MAPRDEESPADYNPGGYLHINLHDSFHSGRYSVIRKLGWGHFSTVWLVRDQQTSRHSALKVVKSAGRYSETARDEIKLLNQIADTAPSHPGRPHLVSFLDAFAHSSSPSDTHVCIVFEPLGANLLSLIEKNRRTGVPPALVKSITRQLLLGLQFLHDACDLVHTDIKPENIMISIPDIESHILSELSSSPPPQSHKLPIPPSRSRRSAAAAVASSFSSLAAATSSSAATLAMAHARDRSVHIFESQPLASPSRRHMHAHLSAFSAGAAGSASTCASSYQGSLLRDADAAMRLSMTAVTTPATSLGSAMSKLQLSSRERPPADSPRTTTTVVSADTEPEVTRQPSLASAAPAGPSLLAQTAPHHRSPSSPPSPSSSSSDPSSSSSSSPASSSSSASSAPTSEPERPPSPPHMWHPLTIKIADLGNATPSKRHFTEEIQTRQYRSPEAILGRTDWGCEVDMWSVACVVFELLTAEYLFEPQSQGQLFSKDDDHMAQIIELLGPVPAHVRRGARHARELFDAGGALRYIRHLKPWPLARVMREKYLFGEDESKALCAFLGPMLEVDGRARVGAGEAARHAWLDVDWEREGAALERCVW